MNQVSEQGNEGTPWPKNIAAITLFVDELEITKQFYREIFELRVVFEDDNSVVFKIGTTLINLLRSTEARELIEPATVARHDDGSRFVFTIEVDDVDEMCTKLTTRGVSLLNGPMDRPWGVRTASFVDPGGHIWEIAK
ncbi:MAG: VOC family protein [Anaerolineae bacterium]|nr:VOC family protein [Anaerolineae bacterium]